MRVKSGRKAHGVIFDMDGILFDTENIYQKYWNEIAHEMGLELEPSFKTEITGTNGERLLSIVRKHYHVDDPERILDEVTKRSIEELKCHVPLKPGVREFLEYLKEKHIRSSIASATEKQLVKQFVKVAGLEGFFDEITSGSEVEHGKPSPDVFLLAARRLGIEPGRCIVFEDSYNGIRAARSAGSLAIMIPDMLPPTDEMRKKADQIYSSFNEFLLDASDWIE